MPPIQIQPPAIQDITSRSGQEFRSAEYDRPLSSFSDADLLACYIHAAIFTGLRRPQGAKAQQKVNEPCTAVGVTREQLYIAFNGISLDKETNPDIDKMNKADMETGMQGRGIEEVKVLGYCEDVDKIGKAEYDKEKRVHIAYEARPTTLVVLSRDSGKISTDLMMSGAEKVVSKTVIQGGVLDKWSELTVVYSRLKCVVKKQYKLKSASSTRNDPLELLRGILVEAYTNTASALSWPRRALVIIAKSDARTKFHAEMQIVYQLLAAQKKLTDLVSMGVSKPCCNQCKDRLDGLNILYSCWTQLQYEVPWIDPDAGPSNQRFFDKPVELTW